MDYYYIKNGFEVKFADILELKSILNSILSQLNNGSSYPLSGHKMTSSKYTAICQAYNDQNNIDLLLKEAMNVINSDYISKFIDGLGRKSYTNSFFRIEFKNSLGYIELRFLGNDY